MLKRLCVLAVQSHVNYSHTQRAASSVSACVVGAGPAGYYTAQRLLKVSQCRCAR